MTAWWDGPLVGFDVETTGVNVFNDRIVTAAIVSVIPGKRPHTHAWLVDPGVDIPQEATDIHGITTADARASGTPAEQAIFEISARLAMGLHHGVPLVAFNAAFDLSMLEAENDRYDLPTLAHRLAPKPILPVVDPFVIDRACDTYRKGSRKLDAMCGHYGVTLAGAHTSDADALAAVRLAVVIGKAQKRIRGWTLIQLHERQIDWHRDRQASLAEYFRKQGKPADDVNGEWPVRSQPSFEQGAIA